MMVLKKRWFIITFIVVSILLSAGYGVGSYFVNYALSPSSSSDQREIDESDEVQLSDSVQKQIDQNQEKEMVKGIDFESQTKPMIVSSDDSLNLKGKYLDHENTHQWVILIHGYKSSNENMMSYGATYYEHGYNVVLPDNRAHGKSDGEYIGMGWLDKDDIACWVNWIIEKDNQAQIILHGVSMGGATVMMASGDHLPHVVGYIEDCGYTSVWDIFASELDKRFSLPTFPVLDISNFMAQIRAGYDFKEASSLEQVKKANAPMLFIHGGKDDFVPVDMVYEVYDACPTTKELYIVKEAGHAQAKDYDVEDYWNKVFDFIDQNIWKDGTL
ncbi:alpha/beta hydrolase [Massilimicrobiota timonensis]|uniref:Alpha/beta hydrolase n=2 Tax=Massilimicrobiota timonensis TaxID=1776392 RepID=A0A1Y4SY51_9FIRM|nr:alpha/beta hydrolase [Massilimicrobiota timonensis]